MMGEIDMTVCLDSIVERGDDDDEVDMVDEN
jgi:hypothetical protein